AGVKRGAAGQRFVSESWATVILEWAEHGVGVDLITGRIQETATVIVAKIVAERGHDASIKINDVGAAIAQDGIANLERRVATVVPDAAGNSVSPVAAQCAVSDRQRPTVGDAAAVCVNEVPADRAVGDRE